MGFFYHFNAALTVLYYICSISPLLPGGSYLRFSRFCVSSNQNNLFYHFDFTLLYDRPPCHDIFFISIEGYGNILFFCFLFFLRKVLMILYMGSMVGLFGNFFLQVFYFILSVLCLFMCMMYGHINSSFYISTTS